MRNALHSNGTDRNELGHGAQEHAIEGRMQTRLKATRRVSHRRRATESPTPGNISSPWDTDNAQATKYSSAKVSIVILTALSLEYMVVKSHLTDIQDVELKSGTLVEVGKFATKVGNILVGAVEVGAGATGPDSAGGGQRPSR